MGYLDYYKDFCKCGGRHVPINMRDLDGDEVYSYPVNVYSIYEEFIGIANTKEEYIELWNSDGYNNQVGVLMDHVGPFTFTLILNTGATLPDYVIGDTGDIVYGGIYALEYDDYYE